MTKNHGIYLASNSAYKITFIASDVIWAGLSYAGFDATLPKPVSFLSSYAGTYAATATQDIASNKIVASNGTAFLEASYTATSLTIAPVPEPSTYALAAIASGVLAVAARRRRVRKS